MKKFLLMALAIATFAISSCVKEQVIEESPGNIPGMGETPGSLQVISEFEFPDGIIIDGKIRGSDGVIRSQTFNPILKDEGGGDKHNDENGCNHGSDHTGGQGGKCEHGSGGQWISLDLTFVNITDLVKEIRLPAGLLFECEQEGYQHGILIQEVLINIKGRGAVNVKLNLYCINQGRGASDITLSYQLRGITSSQHMGHLATKLAGKKIDVIYFNETDITEYHHMTDQIQNLVWAITNGSGIDQAGWEFIESLQDLIN